MIPLKVFYLVLVFGGQSVSAEQMIEPYQTKEECQEAGKAAEENMAEDWPKKYFTFTCVPTQTPNHH